MMNFLGNIKPKVFNNNNNQDNNIFEQKKSYSVFSGYKL